MTRLSPRRFRAVLFAALILAVSPLLAPLAAQGACASTITFSGPGRIGTTIQMTITGSSSCHSCVWISKNPGPTSFPPIVVPIGLPLLSFVDYGALPASGQLSVPIVIPNDPNIIGLQLFLTNVSYPLGSAPSFTNIEFSPAAILTFVP